MFAGGHGQVGAAIEDPLLVRGRLLIDLLHAVGVVQLL